MTTTHLKAAVVATSRNVGFVRHTQECGSIQYNRNIRTMNKALSESVTDSSGS